jgi:hypothetical protein
VDFSRRRSVFHVEEDAMISLSTVRTVSDPNAFSIKKNPIYGLVVGILYGKHFGWRWQGSSGVTNFQGIQKNIANNSKNVADENLSDQRSKISPLNRRLFCTFWGFLRGRSWKLK